MDIGLTHLVFYIGKSYSAQVFKYAKMFQFLFFLSNFVFYFPNFVKFALANYFIFSTSLHLKSHKLATGFMV